MLSHSSPPHVAPPHAGISAEVFLDVLALLTRVSLRVAAFSKQEFFNSWLANSFVHPKPKNKVGKVTLQSSHLRILKNNPVLKTY